MMRFEKMKRAITMLPFLALATAYVTTANAQQQGSNQQKAKVSGWFKTCNEEGGNKFCNVQFRVVAPNGANITTINLIKITGEVTRDVFQIHVPVGRSLPQGIQLRIDEKKATAIPYRYCRPQGCTAEIKLDDTLVGIFKKGVKLDITTINYQGKANQVPITLKGFTAAFDGPPIKQETASDRQKNLEEELKKKAEEKLKEAE